MKAAKRFFSLLLCTGMLLSLLPQGRALASDISDNGLCAHHPTHTEDCGYREATESETALPCQYTCPVCSLQELIDVLPGAENVSDENAQAVRTQLNAIEEAAALLSDAEKNEVDFAAYDAVVEKISAIENASDASQQNLPSDSAEDPSKPAKESSTQKKSRRKRNDRNSRCGG